MKTQHKKEWIYGYFFISPLFIGLTIFYIYPFIRNFLNSFYDIHNLSIAKFIGAANYKQIIYDAEFWQTAYNTCLYVVIAVPGSIIISTALAELLHTDIKGKSFYRTLYFLPAVTMPVAVAMVWKWIFNGQYGLLNQLLLLVNIPGKNWLSNPATALYMIIVVSITSEYFTPKGG